MDAPAPTAHPDVAVDVVPLTWREAPAAEPLRAELLVGLLERRPPEEPPHGWALPGAYVQAQETVEARASHVFADKVGLPEPDPAHLLHLRPFSEPDRDPRRRTISLPVLALLPNRGIAHDELRGAWAVVEAADAGEVVVRVDGRPVQLLFDHAAVVATAIGELRRRLQADDLDVVAGLLPPAFALRELERLWNALVGTPVNTASFRRRMTGLRRPGPDGGRWLEETGETGARSSGRQAKLYRWGGVSGGGSPRSRR